MPTVPRYDSFQVQENPLPSGETQVQFRPDNFGASINKAMGDVGEVAFKYAEQERERADEISLLEAERKFQEWELTNVEAALDMRGKDAIALPDQFFPEMDRALSDISQSIPSDRARLAFQQRALTRSRGITLTINRHVRSEIDQHDAAETQAVIANSQQAAAMNFNDPARIAEEIERQHEAIAARGRRIGADKEVLEQLTTDATSKTHVGVISRMLGAEQYGMAREYFDANAEDMLVKDRDAVKGAVLEAGVRVESTAAADRIMNTTDSRSAALKIVDDMEAGPVRDATRQRINQRYNEQNTADEENKKARMDTASRLVQDSGGDMNAIPPDMYNLLEAGEIAQLKALANYTRTGMPATDDRVIWAFSQMSDEALLQTNLLTTARPHMDDTHYYRLLQRQQDIRDAKNGDKDAASRRTATTTFTQSLESAAREFGVLDPTKTMSQQDESKRKLFLLYQNAAVEAVDQATAAKGGTLTALEVREVIVDVFARKAWRPAATVVSVPRERPIIWDATDQFLINELPPEQRANAYVPVDQIPPDQRAEITNLVLANNFGGRSMESLVSSEESRLNKLVGKVYAAMQMDDPALVKQHLGIVDRGAAE